MLQFAIDTNQNVIGIATDHEVAEEMRAEGRTVISRHDITSMAQAEELAEDAGMFADQLGQDTRYIATDGGAHRWPRYDVIPAPAIGAEVSRAFNGDSYPAGEIVKISASLRRVETSDGTVFWRKRQSGAWVADGTWGMVPGHVERRNPSF